MKRVAIIAAMPGELKPFLDENAKEGWVHEQRGAVSLWRLKWPDDQGEWVAACAGAGVDCATRAFAEAELVLSRSGEGIDLVISTGWAGALDAKYLPGEVYWLSGVIDVRTGERFFTSCLTNGHESLKGHGFSRAAKTRNKDSALAAEGTAEEKRYTHQGQKPEESNSTASSTAEAVRFQNGAQIEIWLATSPKVADQPEKLRLASAYNAALVDMEAAAIARAAQRRGIPFYCCKGVSDGYSDHLPDFNSFISKTGKFQLARFVLFALLRPWYWSALIRMGENSKKSAEGIATAILALLDEKGTTSL